MLKKILNNSVLALIASVFSKVGAMIITIVTAQYLSKSEVGVFMMVRNTIAMVDSVIGNSIGNSLIVEAANSESKENLNHVLLKALACSVFLTAILCIIYFVYIVLFFFILNSPINLSLFGWNVAFIEILAISTLFFSSLTISNVNKVLIGGEKYKELLKANVISFSLLIFAFYIFYSFSFKISSLIDSFIIFFSFLFVDLFFKLKLIGVSFHIFFKPSLVNQYVLLIKRLFSSNSILVFSALVTAFFFYIIKGFVSLNYDGGLEVIADFEMNYMLVTIILIITGALTNVSMQMMASAQPETLKIFFLTLALNIFLAIFISFGFYFFAPYFYSLLGGNYIYDDKTFYSGVVFVMLTCIQSVLVRFLIVNKVYKKILTSNLVAATSTLMLLLFLEKLTAPIIYNLYSCYLFISTVLMANKLMKSG